MVNRIRSSLACLALGLVLGMATMPHAHAQTRVPKDVQEILDGLKAEEDEQAEPDADDEAEPEKPLTKDDVQLYLKVMRAAAARVRAFPAADRALMEKAAAVQTGKKDISSLTPDELSHIQELSSIDETVAREMNVLESYGRVPSLITTRVFDCDSCGDPEAKGKGGSSSSGEKQRAFLAQARAEAALIAPHRKEIKELERQVHPFSPLGYYPSY